MAEFYIDLHIHTALSPCCDDDMTPNNIVNMALLKGLDFIAITDHNCAKNVESVIKCAKGKDIVVVPGMEVETSEEIHVLCLFENLENLAELQNVINQSLPKYKNRQDIYGQQLIIDEYDNFVQLEEKMLSTACSLSVYDIVDYCNKNNGIAIPAHINRESYSIINTLGVIPEDLNIKTVEVSRNFDNPVLKSQWENNYNVISSSDAHRLGDILEREMKIELKNKSIDGLFEQLNKTK